MTSSDFVNIVASKREVLATDIGPALTSLRTVVTASETVKRWFSRVDISVDGYNDDSHDLFEIPEVRT